MRIPVFTVTVLVLVFCGNILAQDLQEQRWIFKDSFLAYRGHDVVADGNGGLCILGSEYGFFPPYPSGTPIEPWDVCYGNIFFHLDEDGNILEKISLENTSFPYHYMPPASTFLKASDSLLYIPFGAETYSLECMNRSFFRNTIRGIVRMDKRSERFESSKTMFLDSICGSPQIIGSSIIEDRITVIARDEEVFSTDHFPIIIHTLDSEGNLLYSEYSKTFNWFDLYPYSVRNSLIEKENSYLLLGGDKSDGSYQMCFLELSKSGDSLQLVRKKGGRMGEDGILHYDENVILVKGLFQSNTYIVAFDWDLDELWTKNLGNKGGINGLKNMVALPSGGYLALIDGSPTRGNFEVLRLDENGEVISAKTYPSMSCVPGRISLIGENAFAIAGNYWVGYEPSSIGNPYSQLFVLKDYLDNLKDVVGTKENDIDTPTSFSVFPNPVNDKTTLRLHENSTINRAFIKDIFGHTITTFEVQQTSLPLDFSALSGGVYFISLLSDEKLIGTQRVIKL